MKIALYGGHTGEIRMMKDLLEDHEVTLYDNSYYATTIEKPKDEQVAISLFPYRDISFHDGSTPLIIYATNPFPDPVEFMKVQYKSFVTTITDAEADHCYPSDTFPVKPALSISHSIKPSRVVPYVGDINMIAVVNRKPFSRWNKLMTGLFKQNIELTEFLAGVPFVVLSIPDEKQFYETLSHYKAVFYYSDNPYTLFMYEMMTMGMPAVAFNSSWIKDPYPIKKYFKHYSTNEGTIRNIFHTMLSMPAKKADYKFVPFQEAKNQWNNVVKRYERQ